jgi:HSP20 family protein
MADLHHLDPLNELGAYREAIRQLIDEGWVGPRDLLPAALAAVLVPVDVIDTDDALVVRVNVPGVPAEELKITLSGHVLTLKGETKEEGEFENPRFIRRERRATAISRTVDLPAEVDADRAEARFRNGVLTLTLPKNEQARPKRIKITSE